MVIVDGALPPVVGILNVRGPLVDAAFVALGVVTAVVMGDDVAMVVATVVVGAVIGCKIAVFYYLKREKNQTDRLDIQK